uniref:Uncharacterized protein n=1 Tax=Mycena chlorophos TaxID=658473 RepID=A0ABQ0L3D4_MYCCL|nr:predicted protein [Mycena chlorophos]
MVDCSGVVLDTGKWRNWKRGDDAVSPATTQQGSKARLDGGGSPEEWRWPTRGSSALELLADAGEARRSSVASHRRRGARLEVSALVGGGELEDATGHGGEKQREFVTMTCGDPDVCLTADSQRQPFSDLFSDESRHFRAEGKPRRPQ